MLEFISRDTEGEGFVVFNVWDMVHLRAWRYCFPDKISKTFAITDGSPSFGKSRWYAISLITTNMVI